MTDTANNSAAGASQLATLVQELLVQPYAQTRNLAAASWEKVCALMEGSGLTSSTPLDEGLSDNFEKCRATYCLILMELEALGITPAPDQTMSSWFGATAETKEVNGPTQDYWAVANYFAHLSESELPFPKEYAERLRGQNLSFAIEAECQRILLAQLPMFWNLRQEAIGQVASEAEAFAIQKSLRKALDEMATKHAAWLGDKKFPYTVASLALRYVFARLSPQDFLPAPSEAATLILFFGHTGKLGDWQCCNELGLGGLDFLEVVELSFRLFHAQRLRKRFLSVGEAFDANALKAVIENSSRIIELSQKVRHETSAAGAAA